MDMIIFGAGDQGRMNWEIANILGHKVIAFIDGIKTESPIPGIPFYSTIPPYFSELGPIGYVVAVGAPHSAFRLETSRRMKSEGFTHVNLIHPSAIISPSAKLGLGIQIMAGVHIGMNATIGNDVIINANSNIDHDCVLGDGVEIAPGVTLCGRVNVGERTWICVGSSVGPRLSIGPDTIIGANSTVLYDIPANVWAWGSPVRVIKNTNDPIEIETARYARELLNSK